MGRFFTYQSGAASLLDLPKKLYTDGDKVAPRGIPTREHRNVMIEIEDPFDCTMLGIGRGWNKQIAAMEALQLIGGFSDPATMVRRAPNFEPFLNGGSFHGAYGPRISMQMPKLISRLQRDPDTRQGVVTIWDPLHDLMQEDRNDLPCTIGFNFSIRRGALYMSTHMRSNDIWWGWSYDLFQFTQLQMTVATILGIPAGSYLHYVDSLHLYERDADKVFALQQDKGERRPFMRGLSAHTWPQAQEIASQLFYGNKEVATQHPWWAGVMNDGR